MLNTENFVATATINSKGQITLPQAICDKLGCKAEEMIKFTVQDSQILLELTTHRETSNDVFVPADNDLLFFGKCLGQCTIC